MVSPMGLRKQVVAAVSKVESCRVAAARFGAAVSSVVKRSQRYRATGSVKPGKTCSHRKTVLEPHGDFIKWRIRQTPHLTLHALRGELATRGAASRTKRYGCSCTTNDRISNRRGSEQEQCMEVSSVLSVDDQLGVFRQSIDDRDRVRANPGMQSESLQRRSLGFLAVGTVFQNE